jgi:hypothetical protein
MVYTIHKTGKFGDDGILLLYYKSISQCKPYNPPTPLEASTPLIPGQVKDVPMECLEQHLGGSPEGYDQLLKLDPEKTYTIHTHYNTTNS